MKKTLVLIVLLLFVNSFTLLAQNNKADTSASKKDAAKSAVSNTPAEAATNAQPKPIDKKALEKALKQANQKKQADSIAAVKQAKIAADKLKKDTEASAKNAVQAAQKKQSDSLAAVKTAKLTTEKLKKDSISSAKKSPATTSKINPAAVTQTPVPANLATQPKPDTSRTVKNIPQIAAQKSTTDSLVSSKKDKKKKNEAKLSSNKNVVDSIGANGKKVKPPKGKSAKELKREAKKNDINNLSEKDLANMAFKNLGVDSSVRSTPLHPDMALTNARPLPLVEQQYNDIKFYHRYWRDIDLQDPKNKRLAQYHADFITALLNAIKNKEIKAYSPVAGVPQNPTGDAFTIPIPYLELMSGLSDTSVVNEIDKDGNITGTKTIPNPFTPAKIAGYRIKEDVYIDRVRSRTVTRIIGIAPLIKLTLSSGEVLNIQPLCWLKYKDCRKIAVTIDTDPTKKIGDSLDDIFLQRRFYGKIVQESNPDGKRIKDYKNEVADQEAEAQRIEKKVVVFKKGTWNYTMLNVSPEPEQTTSKPKPKEVKPKVTKPKD